MHYDVRFAALAPPGAVGRISAESRELAWFAPDALPAPLGDATDRLVARPWPPPAPSSTTDPDLA